MTDSKKAKKSGKFTDPVTIELTIPVEYGGKELTELTMRPPKVKDRTIARSTLGKKADDEEEAAKVMIANLCSVPPSVIEELSLVDYMALSEALMGFLPSTTTA